MYTKDVVCFRRHSMQTAVFGGGCFWCTEAVFSMVRGVMHVQSGYAGGTKEDATYERVSTGDTHHAEVIKIDFDESEIPFRDLLTVFFYAHDATQLNQQGNDVGTQYRSVIFYAHDDQKKQAETYITELQSDGTDIVTTLEPLTEFYEAEEYHDQYYARNKTAPYCQVIIAPKIEKVEKAFALLIKKHD